MGKYENIGRLIEKSTSDDRNREFANQLPDYIDDDVLIVHDATKIPEIYSSRMHANLICFCLKGSMDLLLNGNAQSIEAGDVLVCPSNSLVERPMISPDFRFTLMGFTDNALRQMLSSNMDIWNKASYVNHGHVMKPRNGQDLDIMMQAVGHATALAKLMMGNTDMAFKREMIHSLLRVVLLAYCSIQHEHESAANDEQDSKQPRQQASKAIFNSFLKLLRDEPMKHRPVSYYAELLYITPKHLNYVCNQVSGRTATEVIQGAVTEEIIGYLRNPNYTVKQIASQVGFASISSLGKFVKKQLGVSPNDYRRALQAQ